MTRLSLIALFGLMVSFNVFGEGYIEKGSNNKDQVDYYYPDIEAVLTRRFRLDIPAGDRPAPDKKKSAYKKTDVRNLIPRRTNNRALSNKQYSTEE